MTLTQGEVATVVLRNSERAGDEAALRMTLVAPPFPGPGSELPPVRIGFVAVGATAERNRPGEVPGFMTILARDGSVSADKRVLRSVVIECRSNAYRLPVPAGGMTAAAIGPEHTAVRIAVTGSAVREGNAPVFGHVPAPSGA